MMRILFVSNFYPPASRGGYEQWCQEMAERLIADGHEVLVLTSNYGQDTPSASDLAEVRRELCLEMELASFRNAFEFFTKRKAKEQHNLARLEQVVESFAPDVALVWGMWNLPRSLPARLEDLMPARVVYYVADYWPTLPSQFEDYWQVPPRNWATALPKTIMKPVAQHMLSNEQQPTLRFDQVLFPTSFMQEELQRRGMSFSNSHIVYGAVDTSQYAHRNGESDGHADGQLSMLYAGRLAPEKGVHTAIAALAYFVHELKGPTATLTIVGTGEPDYEQYLRQLAARDHVEELVNFVGAQAKEVMPTWYQNAQLFLFTSIWPEPFGRVLVEAMAAGVVVVGTGTGGAAEILKDGENALLFRPDDAIGLATQIARLSASPVLRSRLATAGRRTALENFDLNRMASEIEEFLQGTVGEN